MSKVKVCDICKKNIEDGYRKVKSKHCDGSLHEIEHICDECWYELREMVKDKKAGTCE